MVTTNDRTVTRFSVEPVFSAVALFGICAIANFLSRSRQSIQIGATDNSVLVIRNFDLSQADIRDERSVADALAGAYVVANAVSLCVEHGKETFHSVHVETAQLVAAQAHCGARRLAVAVRRH